MAWEFQTLRYSFAELMAHVATLARYNGAQVSAEDYCYKAFERYPRRLKHGQGVSHLQRLQCLGPVDGAFAAHEGRRFHLARRHEGVATLHPPFGQQEQI